MNNQRATAVTSDPANEESDDLEGFDDEPLDSDRPDYQDTETAGPDSEIKSDKEKKTQSGKSESNAQDQADTQTKLMKRTAAVTM